MFAFTWFEIFYRRFDYQCFVPTATEQIVCFRQCNAGAAPAVNYFLKIGVEWAGHTPKICIYTRNVIIQFLLDIAKDRPSFNFA